MNSVSLVDGHIDGADTCVMCGRDIPEGSQYCVICGMKAKGKMTNYERIKAMSVEEMARFINHCENVPCQCCNYIGNLCGNGTDTEMCASEILKWLNSEVEE